MVLFTHDDEAVKIAKIAARDAFAFLAGTPDKLPKVDPPLGDGVIGEVS